VQIPFTVTLIEAVGTGNVNANMFKAIRYAINKGIPVVITTRVYHGNVLSVYADMGGGATMEKTGAILAGHLITDAVLLPKGTMLISIMGILTTLLFRAGEKFRLPSPGPNS